MSMAKLLDITSIAIFMLVALTPNLVAGEDHADPPVSGSIGVCGENHGQQEPSAILMQSSAGAGENASCGDAPMANSNACVQDPQEGADSIQARKQVVEEDKRDTSPEASIALLALAAPSLIVPGVSPSSKTLAKVLSRVRMQ
jgi:hypothetical protein